MGGYNVLKGLHSSLSGGFSAHSEPFCEFFNAEAAREKCV
jgi:hypothetical protein